MKEQFIPYTQALELKDLGFDEECLGSYNDRQLPYFQIQGQSINTVLAPLWQQAFDWFREKHNLYFEIFNSPMYVHGWKFRTYYIENNRLRNADVSEIFDRYEDVKLACLVKLISIVKNLKS